MKINQIVTEFVQTAPVEIPADDAPPSQGFAIKVHGPFGARFGGIPAATLWYALSNVFPNQYPPRDYQNYGAQLDSPQARVLNQIHRSGSAVVADGIAGRDLAETLANKLAMFKPEDQYLRPLGSKHVEVVESGLDESVSQGMAEGDLNAMASKILSVRDEDGFITIIVQAPDGTKRAVSNDNPNYIQRWLQKYGLTLPPSITSKFVGLGEASKPPVAPDPQNYDSDWDYYNDRDAEEPPEDDWYDDPETDDDAWMGETREKVGNMDADAFDDAIARMKKLAGAGPLRTVYDPAKRVYKNVPTAQQPAKQPKK